MFNDYQWKNYLKSGGDKIVKTFDDFIKQPESCNAKKVFGQLYRAYNPCKWIVADFDEQINAFYEDMAYEEYTDEEDIDCSFSQSPRDSLDAFLKNMQSITLMMAYKKPDVYIPYFFQFTYNVLQSIANYFEIELPVCPKRNDYAERITHYEGICAVFQSFRKDMGWTPAILWAFLYDYAPKCVGGKSWVWGKLPRPRAAYFIGCSPDAGDLPEKGRASDYVSLWQSNPDSQPGDVNVMYLTSPASEIGYILRTVSPGFVDPFFWYYRCVYIGKPIKVTGLSLNAMKNDPILSEIRIVRKNMQGINGSIILPGEYNRIIDSLQIIDPDSECLEKIDFRFEKSMVKIENEADVESMLLEPLLERLGWSRGDYVRQMPLRMGRKNVVYPDYAICPDFTPGRENALWVWEAKKNIHGKTQLETDLGQARSYARRLDAKGLGLVSEEGVWLALADDDFVRLIPKTWKEIENPDDFSEIYKLA
jgi:hypothetical protein